MILENFPGTACSKERWALEGHSFMPLLNVGSQPSLGGGLKLWAVLAACEAFRNTKLRLTLQTNTVQALPFKRVRGSAL